MVDGTGWWIGGRLVGGGEDVGVVMEEGGEPRGFGGWGGGIGGGEVVEVDGEDLVFMDLGFSEGGG